MIIRMYGHLAATYESAATRLFLLGRTDTIRACSAETLSFCKAMSDPTALVSFMIDSYIANYYNYSYTKLSHYVKLQNNEKVAMLKTAIEAHRKYTLEVCM